MSTAVVKATPELDALGMNFLRQKVIVHLLRESSWEPTALANYLIQLISQNVLTQEVREEIHELVLEKDLVKLSGQGSNLLSNINTHASDCKDNAVAHHGIDVAAAVRSDACAPVASPPSRFEQEFDRLELLGRGGFGEVWRARSRVDNKEYAIKMVQYCYNSKDGPYEHPALREAQAWADVKHPNAVRYHTAWVEVADDWKQVDSKCPKEEFPRCQNVNDISSTEASSDCTSSSSIISDQSTGGVVFAAEDESLMEQRNGFPQNTQIVPRTVTGSRPIHRATLFLQTELIRGGTLRDWIDERNASFGTADFNEMQRQASCKAAENIFRQIVDAVANLHAKGLVHRDIKPANILLTEAGEVRLGDFGLAKVSKDVNAVAPALENGVQAAKVGVDVTRCASSKHTRGVGTPSYASPEQMNDTHYGSEVDIYALGVVLAELLFPMQTEMERARLLDGLRLGQLPVLADALSPGAADVVLKMTSLNPKERPAAHELAALLHQRATLQQVPSATCPQQMGSVASEPCCYESVRVTLAA